MIEQHNPTTARKLLQIGRRKCVHCGKHFKPTVWNKKFCSRICFVAHNRETIRARQRKWEALHHPRKKLEIKVCAQCGEEFRTSKSWHKFCSEKCRDKDHYIRHKPRYSAYTKQYRADHPDKAKAARQRAYKKHKAARNAYTKARYARQKKKLIDAQAELVRLRALTVGNGNEKDETLGRITVKAYLDLCVITEWDMGPILYPEQRSRDHAYKSVVRLRTRKKPQIDAEKARLCGLSSAEQNAEALTGMQKYCSNPRLPTLDRRT